MPKLRDHLWLWGHTEGSHTHNDEVRKQWGLPGPSRMTPTEACYYMGVPNCVMVVYANQPAPPFHQEALAMSTLDKVVWSVIGDAGSHRTEFGGSDLDEVLKIAGEYPNISGAMMDDFFSADGARQTPETLGMFRERLHGFTRPLDLWVVVYDSLDVGRCGEHLAHCDVLSYWTWEGRELATLEERFARFVDATPDKRRVLGCYMWDYGQKQPMDVAQMEYQCGLGLRWLKEGSIEGMILLASCVCDLDLEAVEWTRDWVAQVGDEEL